MTTDTNAARKLEALLDAAVDAIITIDHKALIQSANRAAEKLFGYEPSEFIGQNVKFLMPEPWLSEHDRYLQRYQETGNKRIIGIGREVEGMRKDGTIFPMHLSVSEYDVDGQVFYTGIIHDLTARKHASEVLQRSQKMEAIGQLTGGIAHDFNNLLTVITGNLELLEMQISEPGQLELLKEAQEAAELGADLTNRLLAFARRSVLQPEEVNINAMIENLASMLERTLGGQVRFETALADDLWNVLVDPGQVESAILNLAVNSRDAMPRGGSLVVETANVVIDEAYTASEVGLETGEYVRIAFSDTGKGMSEEVVQRAFEPFFTTKESGRGTGLGLPMVYGFAKQSGGNATIYSEVDFGTTVNIYLPRQKSAATLQPAVRAGQGAAIPDGEQELVLVVEDNPQVRRLTLERLKKLNYRTLEAEDGRGALRLLADNDDIDLVFTDLVMPGGLSGYELAEIVGRRYPHLSVLLTSGYAEDLLHADKLAKRSVRLLRKPYKQEELARLLRDVLANGR